MSLLEVENLRVTYGGVVAVRDVSLSVAPGEVVAVLGANGAGKTTTLLAVSGLVKVRGGDVRVDGRSIVGASPEGIARQGIAVVMVEQFVGQALQVADRAVVLEQGTVVASGAPSELSSDDIAAAYLGGGEAPAVTVRPAPDSARERIGVALRGSDARRLERLAASSGRAPEEMLGELVSAALAGDGAPGGEDAPRRRRRKA